MSKKRMSRRDFLKFTAAGLGGCVYLGANEKSLSGEVQKEKEEKIIYRTLGKTGIKLPVITMGVQNSDNPNLVRAALDAGMVHLDTAHYYQRGTNEVMIGEVSREGPGILLSSPPRRVSRRIESRVFIEEGQRKKPFCANWTLASNVWGWSMWIFFTIIMYGREKQLCLNRY